MKNELILCDCDSAEHQMILRFDDDKDLGPMVYIEIHLVNKRWYERLWAGLKYIFGYKCRYSNFEEMILSPKHARQIYGLYRFLRERDRSTVSPMEFAQAVGDKPYDISTEISVLQKKGDNDANTSKS